MVLHPNQVLVKVKDAKSIDPQFFPTPDYSHIGKGNIKVSRPVFIPFDRILIEKNRGRHTDVEPGGQRMTRLKYSFAPGIKTSEFLPAVFKRNVDSSEQLQYELLYGYGRIFTFCDEFGATGYWFNVIEANDTDLEWICLNENETLEKLPNKEIDVTQTVTRLVQKGSIKANQRAIEKAIRLNLPYRAKQSRDRIVAAVCKNANVALPHVTYTDGTVKRWIEDSSAIEYVIGGKYDYNQKKFGFCSKANAVQHVFHKAAMIYAKTGKKSYCLVHYDLPTENSTFQQKHENLWNVIEEYHNNYTKLGMDTRSFLTFEGAIPQDRENHNWKYLVRWSKNKSSKKTWEPKNPMEFPIEISIEETV